MSEVEITQADREAAASILVAGWMLQHGGTMPWMFAQRDEILAGCKDETEHVRTFARHRIAARNATLEEAAKIAEERWSELCGSPEQHVVRAEHGKAIATQIRQLSHHKEG